jgi:hypothetical protein
VITLLTSLALAQDVTIDEPELPLASWGEPLVEDALLEQYERRRLELVSVKRQPVDWVIQDGAGNPVDSFWLSTNAPDVEAAAMLQKEQKQARILGWSTAGAGALLLGLAAVPILSIEHDLQQPRWATYEERVDRNNYSSEAEYLAALEDTQAQYTLDLGKYNTAESRNADRRWMGLALAGGGVMTMAVAPYAMQGFVASREQPARTWSRARAEALVEEHNRRLRAELGLPGGEIQVDELDEQQGWEQARAYEPAPRFLLSPALAPNYVGLTVRF